MSLYQTSSRTALSGPTSTHVRYHPPTISFNRLGRSCNRALRYRADLSGQHVSRALNDPGRRQNSSEASSSADTQPGSSHAGVGDDPVEPDSEPAGRSNRDGRASQQGGGHADIGHLAAGERVSLAESGESLLVAAGAADAESGDPLLVAAGASQPSQPVRQVAWALMKATWKLLRERLWLMVAIFSMCDAATFLLHRLSHRITNELAMRALSGVSAADIGNVWYLSNNAYVANFQTGYQYLVIVFFLVVFPLNVLLRSCATCAAVLSCTQPADAEGVGKGGWRPPVRALWREIRNLSPRVRALLANVWQVNVQVALRALPLQALSLAVLPLPWTLPRLLRMQLANPVAVLEETPSDLALGRSEELVTPIQWGLALPYLALLAVPRVLTLLKETLVRVVPPRILRDVPELPLAAYVALVAVSVIVSRLQDLLPVATYLHLTPRGGSGHSQTPESS